MFEVSDRFWLFHTREMFGKKDCSTRELFEHSKILELKLSIRT